LVIVEDDISLRERGSDRGPQPLPRRQGAVLAAVTTVLESVVEPLPVRAIRAAVERLVGAPVPYSSVKDALAIHARGDDRRFRRTDRGCYELVQRPGGVAQGTG
jgi:hypothetical protein